MLGVTSQAVLLLGSLIYCFTRTEGQHPNEYREECKVWQNVTNWLNQPRSGIEMTCTVDQFCLGYDCNSKYKYSGIFTLWEDTTEDYCFGLAIHPCHTPTDMHFYVMHAGSNESFQQNLQSGEVVPIPGATYAIGGGSATVFVAVDMKQVTIRGHEYLNLGVKLKVRVDTQILTYWPPGMQRTLMPDMEIPVPPCAEEENPTVPTSCALMSGTPPPFVTPSNRPAGLKECEVSKLSACQENELCFPKMDNAKTGICICAEGYVVHASTGSCVPMSPPTSPVPMVFIDDKVFEPQTSGKSKTNALIIVGCVFGVVFMLGLLFAMVFIKYRRYRARYGRHSLLVNADNDDEQVASRLPDDDDDEPLDLTGDAGLQFDA